MADIGSTPNGLAALNYQEGLYKGVANNGFQTDASGNLHTDVAFHSPDQASAFGFTGDVNAAPKFTPQNVNATDLNPTQANRLSYLQGLAPGLTNNGFYKDPDGTIHAKIAFKSPDQAYEFGYTPAQQQADQNMREAQSQAVNQFQPTEQSDLNAITNTNQQNQLTAATGQSGVDTTKANLAETAQSGANDIAQQQAQLTADTNTGTQGIANSRDQLVADRDAALQKLTMLNQQLQGQDQAVQAQVPGINQNYDTLGNNLKTAAQSATQTLEERANQLGLLQSGLTAAGEGKIQSDLSQNTAQNESARAAALAKVALDRAGIAVNESLNTAEAGRLETKFGLDNASLDIQTAALTTKFAIQSQGLDAKSADLATRFVIGMNAADTQSAAITAKLALETLGLNEKALGVQTKYNADVQKSVTDFLAGKTKDQMDARQQAFDDGVKLAALAATIPQGQSINIPGIGVITGVKEVNKPNEMQIVPDVQGHTVMVDKNSGKIVSDLGVTTTVKSASGSGSGSGSGGNPGFTKVQIEKLNANGIDPNDYNKSVAFLYKADKYSGSELQKLRDAGIDPTNTVMADKFIQEGSKYQISHMNGVNQSGGLAFHDHNGNPITAYQYEQGINPSKSISPADLIPVLSTSNDPGDQKIINDIKSGMSSADLKSRYPYVFGG